MLADAFFDRLVRRLRLSKPQQPDGLSPNSDEVKTSPRKLNRNRLRRGIFSGANNFIMNQPTFPEIQTQIIQNFAAGKPGHDAVLERIVPYADLDAAMDSSARFPPPSCHPGTRLKIGDRLLNWLISPQRQWNLMWLHGPAGTGKSAVAQTFAERCAQDGRLGATFFFSQSNNRNNPDTVIPSIVYQLAVSLPQYKSLVTVQLASDPELWRKTRRTLFKKLIIEPLLQLQTQKQEHIQEPLLIILDGLDECEGEDAQRDIIEMINEVARLSEDFPLVWLICSRPEAHLKYLFSRADFAVGCGREELVIDAESVADVNLYLRDGLVGIKDHFWDAMSPVWPSDEQFTELSRKASGHFAFASTALRYIGDLTYAAPVARLEALLSFFDGVRTGTSNPLEALDILYTRILLAITDEFLPTVKRILGFTIYTPYGAPTHPAQFLCNFLHIDQATFYSAFRKLHSVVDVPSSGVASQTCLSFYHTSFSEFLRDSSRSDKFAIVWQDIRTDCAKLSLAWYKTDLTLFHTTIKSKFNSLHEHGTLPDLKWVSNDNAADISCAVASWAEAWCWTALSSNSEWDQTLLSQIRHFNFRYISPDNLFDDWRIFVNRLWEEDSSSGIIRTEPHSDLDNRLLENMKLLIEPAWSSRPATFPLDGYSAGEYFLVGFGPEAIACWTTDRSPDFGILNYDEAPSKERIDAYQAWLSESEDSD